MRQLVLSIDVGIKNLAFTLVSFDDKDFLNDSQLPINVLMCETIDLTDENMYHQTVTKNDCQLHHNKDGSIKNIVDRIDHFLQEYEPKWANFGEITECFIEQQPIHGITSVEALLFKHFRNRVTSISPCAMHSFFGIRNLDYEQRKEFTTSQATPFLNKFTKFRNYEKLKNHQADALMLFCYEIHKRHKECLIKEESRQKHAEIEEQFEKLQHMSVDTFLNQFKFTSEKLKKRKLSSFLGNSD